MSRPGQSSRCARAICTAEPPELEGAAGAWVRFVRKVLSYVDVFPPISVGAGAGVGLGCGLGWSIRRAYGPPTGFCGAGVGVGIGFGYGQGFGRRFGRDNRNPESMERIHRIESAIENAAQSVSTRFKSLFNRNPSEHQESFNFDNRPANSSPKSAIVALHCTGLTPLSIAFVQPVQVRTLRRLLSTKSQ